MTLLSKGMRATQLYLPNNPVYQRSVENIRGAFRHIWQATDDLHFDVGETDLRWEGAVVYHQEQKNESIAWTLYKDGVRSLTSKIRSSVACQIWRNAPRMFSTARW